MTRTSGGLLLYCQPTSHIEPEREPILPEGVHDSQSGTSATVPALAGGTGRARRLRLRGRSARVIPSCKPVVDLSAWVTALKYTQIVHFPDLVRFSLISRSLARPAGCPSARARGPSVASTERDWDCHKPSRYSLATVFVRRRPSSIQR